MKKMGKRCISMVIVLCMILGITMGSVLCASATEGTADGTETADGTQQKSEKEMTPEEKAAEEARKKEYEKDAAQISSNQWEGWPEGPVAGSEAAIVLEASTGTVLYEKNIDEKLYPASITKILTAILAMDYGKFEDPVVITKDCIDFLRWDESQLALKVGNEMTMEQCMYATLLKSANDAAYALGKNVAVNAGYDYKWFIEQMNAKTAALGCVNSHWVNTNGLHNDEHYTCARDMALIGREMFKYPDLLKVMQTKKYKIEKTDKIDAYEFGQHHRMINKGKYHDDRVVGGKTGRTTPAGSTLVTLANDGNMQLVAVVLKGEGIEIYNDTKPMLDYAFANFEKVEVAGTELASNYAKVIAPSQVQAVSENQPQITVADEASDTAGAAEGEAAQADAATPVAQETADGGQTEAVTGEQAAQTADGTQETAAGAQTAGAQTDAVTGEQPMQTADGTQETAAGAQTQTAAVGTANAISGYVILPKGVTIEQCEMTETDLGEPNQVRLDFTYMGQKVGSAQAEKLSIDLTPTISDGEEEAELSPMEQKLAKVILLARELLAKVSPGLAERFANLTSIDQLIVIGLAGVLVVLVLLFAIFLLIYLVKRSRLKKGRQKKRK